MLDKEEFEKLQPILGHAQLLACISEHVQRGVLDHRGPGSKRALGLIARPRGRDHLQGAAYPFTSTETPARKPFPKQEEPNANRGTTTRAFGIAVGEAARGANPTVVDCGLCEAYPAVAPHKGNQR